MGNRKLYTDITNVYQQKCHSRINIMFVNIFKVIGKCAHTLLNEKDLKHIITCVYIKT